MRLQQDSFSSRTRTHRLSSLAALFLRNDVHHLQRDLVLDLLLGEARAAVQRRGVDGVILGRLRVYEPGVARGAVQVYDALY